jgi:hypothetical protein
VWAARRAGFRWEQIGTVCAIIDRESGGSERAKNPYSTASGICQFLAFWWDGSGDYGWRFDPFCGVQSLKHMEKAVNHKGLGFSPWAPVPAARWSPPW